jgi:hypothetical protein
VAQSPKSGSTAASDARALPRPEVQDGGLINYTLAGLNNLRKQHRHKGAISQRRAQVQRVPLAADSYQPSSSSISISPHVTTSTGH